MKKNIIVVTGGAGFVGMNLIDLLLKKTKFKIISIDNYSSGFKKNHIKSKRVKYIKSDTRNILSILKNSKNINAIFHFGEFARIYQSFLKMNECINSNTIGTNAVFNYCLKNKIKLIYSATSASLGNRGDDKNLSPYAFTKAKNVELLENLRKWFSDRWVNIGKKKKGGGHPPCGTSGKKRGYAKCVPASKAASMTKKQKASATRRKRAAQKKGGDAKKGKQRSKGKKPTYTKTGA